MTSNASAKVLAVVLIMGLHSACSAPAKVTLAALGSSPAGSFTPGLATVPVGIVLGFEVQAGSSTPVTAAVDDPTMVTVAPAVQGAQFVLIGLATGQTTLRVFVNNRQQTELPVQVIPPAL